MFRKILIANRGEIALRIARTCRELGVATVAVHSRADADSLVVAYADESVCIGGAPASQSYLAIDRVIAAAVAAGCDALHPGYGFLSESAELARACERHGIAFIGPRPEHLELFGDKARAIECARSCGVPTVPGSDGPVESAEDALEVARRIGYPVLVKAVSGGGGKGMRSVERAEDLPHALEQARAEARASFGDDRVYLEKLIRNPRHIEVQVLADARGGAIHLGERDCSIQRSNQKLVEESPSPGIDRALAERICEAALSLVRETGYLGAGTVEFVVAEGAFYFIELNARIQVEHPVTEMRCGLDLVREQIRIACGLPLPLAQDQVLLQGHAIECRILAEDAAAGFRPCPGRVESLHLPAGPGVRVDTALFAGAEVPPFYDSLIAKLVVCAPTRRQAIRRMRRALQELSLEGMRTTAPFSLMLLFDPDFAHGSYSTGFLGEKLPGLIEAGRFVENVERACDEAGVIA